MNDPRHLSPRIFVGGDHLRARDELSSAFEAVHRDRKPRLVTLASPPGLGKTRIVHEFYATLAAEQEYWPPAIVDRSEPSARPHKQTHPHAFPRRDREPPWLWWGVSCQRRSDGRYAPVLGDDQTQLDAHLKAFKAREELMHEAKGLVTDHLITVAEALIPILSQVIAAKDLLTAVLDHVRRARHAFALWPGEQVDATDRERPALVTALMKMLTSWSGAGMPLILFVEDAHYADASLIALLEAIFDHSQPIAALCVCTAWGEQLTSEDGAVQANPFSHWLATREPAVHEAAVREIHPVAPEELARLAAAEAPGLEPADAFKLAEHVGGSPMRLLEIVRNPVAIEQIVHGDVGVTPAVIAAMAARVEAHQIDRWQSLDADLRSLLARATLQGQAFTARLLLEDNGDETREPADLDYAVDPVMWVRSSHAYYVFAENQNFSIASGHLAEIASPHAVDVATRRVVSEITRWKASGEWATPDPALGQFTAAMVLDMHVRAYIRCQVRRGLNHEDVLDSAMRAATIDRRAGRIVAATRMLDSVLSCVRRTESAATLGLLRSALYADLGEFDTAARIEREALDDAMQVPHATALQTELRNNLANSLQALRRYDEALALQDAVIAARNEDHGDLGPTTLAARANRARTLAAVGRFDESIAEHRAIARCTDGLPGLETLHVAALSDEAVAMREWGRVAEASPVHERAVAAAAALLGKDASQALAVRNQAVLTAVLLANDDLPPALLAEQEAIVTALTRVHGRSRPTTIAAEQNLMSMRATRQSGPQFIQEYRDLADRVGQQLGSDHPIALSVAHDVVRAGLVSDKTAMQQIVPSRELLARTEAVLGENHPDALAVRATLATALNRAGKLHEAQTEQTEVVRRSDNILGKDHPASEERREILDLMRSQRQDAP